ncbi:hypothetical protein DHEL01_v207354 [Diaporthe helianthi]|uniref:Uncharacterized protein n=1 Tax=Diaporthe helianthi TaxID=158607 RepID=A0A2P5HVH2_DIAHE|nr:hypothetical protein DHEL01_v207354 [Diaporthe helianthi]
MAEALGKAGGKVYCLDGARDEAQARLLTDLSSLLYRQQNFTNTANLDKMTTAIAEENERQDGVIAAAGV